MPTRTEGSHDGEDFVEASMHFLARDKLFEVEKPYSLRFPPEGDLPQSNIKREKFRVAVNDMRKGEPPKLDENGFQITNMESTMQYSDFDDDERIKSVYLAEVEASLLKVLGGKHVHVMDFAVRRRASQFPISTGKEFETLQPAALAHVDFTVREGERLIEVMYGERAVEVLKGHWQIINVWRPLRGPLNDWPLALCDAQSVDFRNDIMAGDIVYENFVTENLQVMHNPDQKWFYLPDQTTSEVLIFKSADSEHSDAPASPHAAFYNPRAARDELPRESIDCRAFVFYADLPEYPPVVEDIFQLFQTHL